MRHSSLYVRPAQSPGEQKADGSKKVQDSTIPKIRTPVEEVELAKNGEAQCSY
jgi:hypothetical protein